MKVRLRPSHEVDAVFDGSKRHLCEMRYVALRPGTYRFSYGYGCNASHLARLDFELETGKFRADVPQTGFASSSNVEGFTQDGVCIYIPIRTRWLDLEVWDSNGVKTVTLFPSWRGQGPPPTSRKVGIGDRQTHRIALKHGEGGGLARIDANGFAFPYLYSLPPYWSKSPHQLLVPRAIVIADGLTVAK